MKYISDKPEIDAEASILNFSKEIAFNSILPYIRSSGKDTRGLGRWCWYMLQGDSTHRTHIVSAYGVSKAKLPGLKTIYQQHK